MYTPSTPSMMNAPRSSRLGHTRQPRAAHAISKMVAPPMSRRKEKTTGSADFVSATLVITALPPNEACTAISAITTHHTDTVLVRPSDSTDAKEELMGVRRWESHSPDDESEAGIRALRARRSDRTGAV